MWLFGQRDPDDYYPKDDIDLLANLANQIAPVIENFRLVEMARQEVEENKRLQQQLIHSQKMEAIGRFSAGIAHDFNNLLSVILGYSSLILEKTRKDKGVSRGLSEIHNAGKRAADLTRQLLAFSRQSEVERKITSINTIILEVVNMISRLTGEDIQVEIDLDQELADVNIDPGQMSQAIINLAVNARDAMPEGGQLTISTRNIASDHDWESSSFNEFPTPGFYVLIKVEDTGTGLDPHIKPHIFEPFFTTKEKDHGTGLGLSMVYGFVRQSDGYISVESEAEKGTAFNILLPVATEEERDRSVTGEAEANRDLSGFETILLVEDEDSVRAITAEILESRGYSVLQANGAQEGLRISSRYEGAIDLLLTDVIMPEMRGPELANLLLERRPETKILFMSGYNEEVIEPINGANGLALIQKPFSPEKLARVVRRTLDHDNGSEDAQQQVL